MTNPEQKTALYLAKKHGIIRMRELAESGVHPETVRRLVAGGQLTRTARGIYSLPGTITEQHGLAAACKLVPNGIICLLSALAFHELGTQMPPEVWIAIERHSTRPRIQRPRLRVVEVSGAAFTEGIEEHKVEGGRVRVYCAAKTVADCFKFRNKTGRDVAVEALRTCYKNRLCSNADLRRYAKICRVLNVMLPYMEAM